MPIGALAQPSTLQQLQAIGLIAPDATNTIPQALLAPPQAPPPSPMDAGVQQFRPGVSDFLHNPLFSARAAMAAGPAPGPMPSSSAPPPAALAAAAASNTPSSPAPDAASTVQSLDAAGDAAAPLKMDLGSQTPGTPGGQPTQQAPQGIYGSPAGQPATTPPGNPQAPSGPPSGPVTAPQAPSAPGAPPGPGASAGPPPSPAPTGNRYQGVWQSLLPGESGGDPNAKNKHSSASGISQITDGTFQSQFLDTPAGQGYSMADKNDPKVQALAGSSILQQNDQTIQSATGRPATDDQLRASWLLGGQGAAALLTHPDTPISQLLTPGAIAGNRTILSPNMTGAQALQSVSDYYNTKAGMGPSAMMAGGSPSGRLANAQSTQAGDPASQGASIGINSDEIMSMAKKLGYQPVTSMMGPGDKYIAMGLGMLGGRTMADSMKNAGDAFQSVRGQDLGAVSQQNKNAMELAQVGINDTRLAQQLHMQQQEMGIKTQQLGIDNKRADATIAHNTVLEGLTYGKLLNSNERVNGGAAAAALSAKQAGNDAEEIIDGGMEARIKAPQLDAMQQLLSSGQASTGPGIAAAKRAVANYFGVQVAGANPDVGQLMGSIMSQERGSGIMGKNMRTQREFNTVMEGMATMDKSPAALTQVVTGIQRLNAMKAKLGDAWGALPPAQQTQFRRDPDALSSWRNQVLDQWSRDVSSTGLYDQNVPGKVGAPVTDPHTGLSFTLH